MSRSLTICAMLVALAAFCLVALALAGRGQQVGAADQGHEHSHGHTSEGTTEEVASRQAPCDPSAPVDNITMDTSFDASNEERIVRVSDNVFLGRVLRKVDSVPPSEEVLPLPATEFAVEVEKNIKGSLTGTVTVSQGGGCDPRYGRVTLINNTPLLEPRQEALFTTVEGPLRGSHELLVYESSRPVVETEEEEARVVDRFQEAEREQGSSAR